jgi:hypothetical protein
MVNMEGMTSSILTTKPICTRYGTVLGVNSESYRLLSTASLIEVELVMVLDCFLYFECFRERQSKN